MRERLVLLTTIPIATPEQAAKFIRELYRPYLCTECGKVFAKVTDRGISFCGHQQNSSKRSDPNTQTRPWSKDIALTPDPAYESKHKPWTPLEPPAWRKVSINRTASGFALAHFGSRIPINVRNYGKQFKDSCPVNLERSTLPEIIALGNAIEDLMK